jgi:hypothetical protein
LIRDALENYVDTNSCIFGEAQDEMEAGGISPIVILQSHFIAAILEVD